MLKSALPILGILVSLEAASLRAGAPPPPGCSDIPLRVTIAGTATTLSGGVYGDQNPSDSVYVDGQQGVYAKFQTCNGTNDFILNLQNSTRSFIVDFSRILLGGDAGAVQPTGPIATRFMNINQVAHVGLYDSGAQLRTCLQANVPLTKRQSGFLRYQHPSMDETTTTGTPGCRSDDIARAANQYSDTSVVSVALGASCSTWTIAPVPLPAGSRGGVDGFTVAGLVQDGTPSSKTRISGGQYNLPFTITVARLDGLGCANLP